MDIHLIWLTSPLFGNFDLISGKSAFHMGTCHVWLMSVIIRMSFGPFWMSLDHYMSLARLMYRSGSVSAALRTLTVHHWYPAYSRIILLHTPFQQVRMIAVVIVHTDFPILLPEVEFKYFELFSPIIMPWFLQPRQRVSQRKKAIHNPWPRIWSKCVVTVLISYLTLPLKLIEIGSLFWDWAYSYILRCFVNFQFGIDYIQCDFSN